MKKQTYILYSKYPFLFQLIGIIVIIILSRTLISTTYCTEPSNDIYHSKEPRPIDSHEYNVVEVTYRTEKKSDKVILIRTEEKIKEWAACISIIEERPRIKDISNTSIQATQTQTEVVKVGPYIIPKRTNIDNLINALSLEYTTEMQTTKTAKILLLCAGYDEQYHSTLNIETFSNNVKPIELFSKVYKDYVKIFGKIETRKTYFSGLNDNDFMTIIHDLDELYLETNCTYVLYHKALFLLDIQQYYENKQEPINEELYKEIYQEKLNIAISYSKR